jgi:CheY-like chemotaxis protein
MTNIIQKIPPMRILAVDDDVLILDLLRGCLAVQDRYELTCSENAEDALGVIETVKTPFDCFLLDIMMPGIDGIELCDMLRQSRRYRTTPILMITASREPDLMERAFHAGATDYISKPLDGVELGARINSASMLNDSLHRERVMRHSLAELTEKMKLKLDEDTTLPGTGVTSLPALENELLRMPSGCYAMSLFSIDISGMRGIYRAVTPAQFRHHLEVVGEAAVAALGAGQCRIAYTGNGRFVGVMFGRRRLDREQVLGRINAQLEQTWNVAASGTPLPPQILVNSISDQRLWSGLSASNQLRAQTRNRDLEPPLARTQEDKLFAQLDRMIEVEK